MKSIIYNFVLQVFRVVAHYRNFMGGLLDAINNKSSLSVYFERKINTINLNYYHYLCVKTFNSKIYFREQFAKIDFFTFR